MLIRLTIINFDCRIDFNGNLSYPELAVRFGKISLWVRVVCSVKNNASIRAFISVLILWRFFYDSLVILWWFFLGLESAKSREGSMVNRFKVDISLTFVAGRRLNEVALSIWRVEHLFLRNFGSCKLKPHMVLQAYYKAWKDLSMGESCVPIIWGTWGHGYMVIGCFSYLLNR